MGTIPAPNIVADASQIAQAPQNALAEYARVAQLKQLTAEEQQQQQAMQLANQEKQRELADQDAFTKTISQFDPNKNTIADLPKMITANGGSGKAALAAQQGLVQQKQNLLKLSDDQFAQQQKQADLVQGVHDEVSQAPPDQKNAVYQAGLQRLEASGVDVSKEPTDYPGDDVFAQHLAPIQLHSAIVSDAAKQREADQKAAEARQQNAAAAHQEYVNKLETASKPQDFEPVIDSLYPPNDKSTGALNRQTKLMLYNAFQTGGLPAAQKVMDSAFGNVQGIAKDIAVQTNPQVQAGKIAVGAAEGAARAKAYGSTREYQVFDNKTHQTVYLDANTLNDAKMAEPGRYTAPAYTPEAIGQKTTTQYFTGGKGGQQLNAFNTAMQHLDLLDSLGRDLQNTNLQIYNRAAQRWAQETGGAAPVNFNAAKNAMAGEVAAALKASGATDQEIEKVDQTFDRAQSPAQLHGAIQTYRSLLKSKAGNLGMQYQAGMQGKPNFGAGEGGGGNSSSSGGDFFSQFPVKQ